MAAGAWSADLLAQHAPHSGIDWRSAIQPRKGHLLQLARPPDMPPLQSGLMEAEYSQVRCWASLSGLMEAEYSRVCVAGP